MKLCEFQAWMSGFSESIDLIPTKHQWERIKAEIAKIEPEEKPKFDDNHYWTLEPLQKSTITVSNN